ncbi:hypothetical protein TRIP_B350092 [uncultured Desulfatiglans sp.]|uniref:Uncharacterized protein n=1 Tax=Uncultured Desulfatiglans sp. TaxID=1748965 RepID=A0A653AA20_UNCDX|nr:hypothetical protein TRIP_B350092 [uncultured Desulfatiglans sp.]
MDSETKKLIQRIIDEEPGADKEFAQEWIGLIHAYITKSKYSNGLEYLSNLEEIILSEVIKTIRAYHKKRKKIWNLEGLIRKISDIHTIQEYKRQKKSPDALKKASGKINSDDIDVTKAIATDYYTNKVQNPEEILLSKEHQKHSNCIFNKVMECLEELTDIEKETILLFFQGLNWAQIAIRRAVTRKAVTETRDRAFSKIIKCVTKLCPASIYSLYPKLLS